jgi:TetR/AcrR family transcriptional regulator, lmrAB and yxaGH operons repressor
MKMSKVPQDVHDSMVIEAWKLIAERGVQGMSTREVLARSGAPRGSVYHYFPRGRVQLIEEAIDRAQQWMGDQINSIKAGTPAAVVDGYVEIWRQVLETTGFQLGCAIAGLVTGAQNPDFLDRGLAAFTAAADALAGRLREVGVADSEAIGQATMLVAAVEGAVLLCRAQRDNKPLQLVAEQLRKSTG